MSDLTIYAVPNRKVVRQLIEMKYDKYVISFTNNEKKFKELGDFAIKYLLKLPRHLQIREGILFWYKYCLGNPNTIIKDANYYQRLLNFFHNRQIIYQYDINLPIRTDNRYIAIIYLNDEFISIRQFFSITQMEDEIGVCVKKNKFDYKLVFS